MNFEDHKIDLNYPCTNCKTTDKLVEEWLDGGPNLTCPECGGCGELTPVLINIEMLSNDEVKISCYGTVYWIYLKNRTISSNGRNRMRKLPHKSPPLNLPPNWNLEHVLKEINRITRNKRKET